MAIELLKINEQDEALRQLVGEERSKSYIDMFRDFVELVSNQGSHSNQLYYAVLNDAYPMNLFNYELQDGQVGIGLEAKLYPERSELSALPSEVDVRDIFNNLVHKLAKCALDGKNITTDDVMHYVQATQSQECVLPFVENSNDYVLHLPTAFKRYVAERLDDLDSRSDLTDDEVRLKEVLEELPRNTNKLNEIFEVLANASNFDCESVALNYSDYEKELTNREISVWLKDQALPDRNDTGFHHYITYNHMGFNRFIHMDYTSLLRYDENALDQYDGDTVEEQMENRNNDLFNAFGMFKDGFARLLGQHGLTFEIVADFNAYKAFMVENEVARNLVDKIVNANDDAVRSYDVTASLVSINEQEMYQMESIAFLVRLKELSNQFSNDELKDLQKMQYGNYEFKSMIHCFDKMEQVTKSYQNSDLKPITVKQMLDAIPDDFVNMALNLKDAPIALYHSDGYSPSNMNYNEDGVTLSTRENPYILPIRDVSFIKENELDSEFVRNGLSFSQDIVVLAERPATPAQLFVQDLNKEKLEVILDNNLASLEQEQSLNHSDCKP